MIKLFMMLRSRAAVRFAIDSGLVAQMVQRRRSFDLAYLCCLPGFIIMAAADEAELVHMIATARDINDALCTDTLEVRVCELPDLYAFADR